jgi:hypothetical protein
MSYEAPTELGIRFIRKLHKTEEPSKSISEGVRADPGQLTKVPESGI